MLTVLVVVSVIIYCRRIKPCQNSSQSTELNTARGLSTVEPGATPHSPSTAANYVQSPAAVRPPPYHAALCDNVPSVGLPEHQSPHNNQNVYVRSRDLPEYQPSTNATDFAQRLALPEHEPPYTIHTHTLNVYVQPRGLPEYPPPYHAPPHGYVQPPSGLPPYHAVYPDAPPSYSQAISGISDSYI